MCGFAINCMVTAVFWVCYKNYGKSSMCSFAINCMFTSLYVRLL